MMSIILGTTMLFVIFMLFVLIVLILSTKDSNNIKISKDIIHYFINSDDDNQTLNELDELVEFSKNNPCSYKL